MFRTVQLSWRINKKLLPGQIQIQILVCARVKCNYFHFHKKTSYGSRTRSISAYSDKVLVPRCDSLVGKRLLLLCCITEGKTNVSSCASGVARNIVTQHRLPNIVKFGRNVSFSIIIARIHCDLLYAIANNNQPYTYTTFIRRKTTIVNSGGNGRFAVFCSEHSDSMLAVRQNG